MTNSILKQKQKIKLSESPRLLRVSPRKNKQLGAGQIFPYGKGVLAKPRSHEEKIIVRRNITVRLFEAKIAIFSYEKRQTVKHKAFSIMGFTR